MEEKQKKEPEDATGEEIDPKRLKKLRTGAKIALTKALQNMIRWMLEGDEAVVNAKLKELGRKFDTFEEAHDRYVETLTEDDDIEASEEYYTEKHDEYMNVLKNTKDWLGSREEERSSKKSDAEATAVEEDPVNETDGDVSQVLQRSLISVMNLPKAELEPFDGDPLKFHSFIAMFDENVHDVISDGKVRLTRLLQYTTGKAKDAIRSCALLGGSKGYTQARSILMKRFGDNHVIAEHVIRSLKHGKPLKSSVELRQFADELQNGLATLQNMGKLQQVDTQSCVIEIADRLQPYLRGRWKKYALEVKRAKEDYPKFEEFVDFIAKQAEEATDPIYGSWNTRVKSQQDSKPAYDSKKSSSSFSTDLRSTPQKKRSCLLCKQDHRLLWCPRFKSMKPTERLRLVIENSLCENCLLNNHVAADCRKDSVCTVPGCGLKHTRFIHIDHRRGDRETSVVNVNSANGESKNEGTCKAVCMPLVPVRVNDKVTVLSLLDTGSNTTFCTRKLVQSLGVQGAKSMFTLNTIDRSNTSRESMVVNLELRSVNGNDCMKLANVHVVDKIPVANPEVNLSDYPHLKDLDITVRGEVGLLIGLDHAEALMPLEVRKGKPGDVYAVRTLYGWSINGPLTSLESLSRRVVSNFVSSNQVGLDAHDYEIGSSIEDKRVLELWNDQVEIVNGHYQLPIPFKANAKIPNNFSVAKCRLESLRGSLQRRNMYEQYDGEIRKLCSKGYAEKVPVYDVNRNFGIWYLPHHGVISANKPGKIRVVFDCASKFMGECLNDKCYRGPDLINKLQHILLRFRKYEFAISADVEAMYYQVLVSPHQRDCLRFLWYDENGTVNFYRMLVHVFGGLWSSSAACYALQRSVNDFDAIDVVRNAVLDGFYVDDFLISVPNREEAREVMLGVKHLLGCAGFNLTKFIVNDQQLISEITEADRAAEVKDLNLDVSSKVLGIKWNVKSDFLYFQVNLENEQPITRRIMLSTNSSLFDPLGMVSPVLIWGKTLLQDATRLKLDWDDPVPPVIAESWCNWIRSLKCLQKVVIPRCFIPNDFLDAQFELHHFSDASSYALGCCSYLRCIRNDGQIRVVLIYGKSKVAPIKTLSVPKLEMQGALIAARIDAMLRKELCINLNESTFWVDSEIVLKYIFNESSRFQVFIENRVSEIRSLTKPHQWRHISGDVNPADDVSRGVDSSQLVKSNWFSGPNFLYQQKCEWKIPETSMVLSPDDPEIKKVKRSSQGPHASSFHVGVDHSTWEHPIDVLIAYHSDWYRLKRSLCWLVRVRDKLRNKVLKQGPLTVSEVRSAEVCILKHVQSQHFSGEIRSLSSGKPVSKSSHIRDLLPSFGDDGLLRVGGRIKNASLNLDHKHPIILPHGSRVAMLVAGEAHNVAHLGVEWSLGLLRSKYWVTRARVLLRKIKNECFTCKKLFAAPCEQKIADLPPERLMKGLPPFSFVGTDCFGPIMVKRGRSQVKRYGCLFSCFATRAVHLEILESMETDSMINALRRFMARRGPIKKLWSDFGSNYVGCHNELSRSLKELDKVRMHNYGVAYDFDWVFNPPCAPHHGGVFERMVQTVKRVLSAVLSNCTGNLTDETLCTFMCEVESIINGRPITKVSSDASDPMALSPNHLLLLRGQPLPIPGHFSAADIYRRRWRYVQHLADVFWSRWVKEYIPQLQKVTKWHKSRRNVGVNDLVLVVDQHTPRNLWPMGIVTNVKVSEDGFVRTVNVKTKSTELVRPITKIVLLEGHIED